MRLLLAHNAVPADALPDEADILVQADAIQEALTGLGHEVDRVACDLDLKTLVHTIAQFRPQAVFNLVESLDGRGRLIPLVPLTLDALGVPYAGCPGDAVYLTSHKPLAKRLMRDGGLPTPAWATGSTFDDGDEWTGPWIIKPAGEDASLGLDDNSLVSGDRAAVKAVLASYADVPGGPWFAEAFIEGREFNIAVLDGPDGPEVLPAAEMTFADYPPGKPRIVGYAAKWHPDSFEYTHTVRRFDLPPADGPLVAEMKSLALASWNLFGLRGWARVDLRVDDRGRPWILEVNVNPCLSPDAGFAAALKRASISFPEAVDRILTSVR